MAKLLFLKLTHDEFLVGNFTPFEISPFYQSVYPGAWNKEAPTMNSHELPQKLNRIAEKVLLRLGYKMLILLHKSCIIVKIIPKYNNISIFYL